MGIDRVSAAKVRYHENMLNADCAESKKLHQSCMDAAGAFEHARRIGLPTVELEKERDKALTLSLTHYRKHHLIQSPFAD